MSSEPAPQPSPQPRPRPRGAQDPGAAELARALGYDPDDPATWPGSAPAVAPGPAAGTATVETPADDEPDEPDEPVTLTDARAMRAVAHPLRMGLLELLAFRQTLTATQASEALGESPANCAFHLRTLAKYGFVREAGGGKGRERPWALANRTMTLKTKQPDPQTALAASELSRLWLERWIDRARRVHGSRNQVPGWEEATGWSSSYVFLTPDEAIRLSGEMRRILHRYESRLTDPALRPDGALPVEWTIFAAPAASELSDPGPAARPDDPDAADGPATADRQ